MAVTASDLAARPAGISRHKSAGLFTEFNGAEMITVRPNRKGNDHAPLLRTLHHVPTPTGRPWSAQTDAVIRARARVE
jgi:hypothetical protein